MRTCQNASKRRYFGRMSIAAEKVAEVLALPEEDRAYLARQLAVLRFGARRVRIRPSALFAWLERGGKTTAA